MNAAKVSTSKRLQRVLGVLWYGDWLTTRDLVRRADVCAVNSCIAELRENGYTIECRKVAASRYEYRLVQ